MRNTTIVFFTHPIEEAWVVFSVATFSKSIINFWVDVLVEMMGIIFTNIIIGWEKNVIQRG